MTACPGSGVGGFRFKWMWRVISVGRPVSNEKNGLQFMGRLIQSQKQKKATSQFHDEKE
jgi:hypothetical protein